MAKWYTWIVVRKNGGCKECGLGWKHEVVVSKTSFGKLADACVSVDRFIAGERNLVSAQVVTWKWSCGLQVAKRVNEPDGYYYLTDMDGYDMENIGKQVANLCCKLDGDTSCDTSDVKSETGNAPW